MTVMQGRRMVGRTEELAALRAQWSQARGGETRMVLLAGEAGIGKTTLLQALAREVNGGDVPGQVLRGQCVPLGVEGLAYAPINQILHELVGLVGTAAVSGWAGAGWTALAPVLPGLVEGDAGATDGGDRLRLFEAVARILEQAAASGPLLVVIEDLHWADESTLGLLRFVIRALGDAPILFVASYRTDELTRRHRLRPVLVELARLVNVTRTELPRLERLAVAELLASILPTSPGDAVVSLINERTQGIPYFVEELATATTAGCSRLPDSLRDALSVRIQRLPDETQALLRLMSTGGNRVDHQLLAAVSEGGDLDEHLRAAIDAQVIVADELGYEFRHALLREVIHEELLPGEHGAMHARFAQVLEQCAELLPETGRPAIPHHWFAAHHLDRAFATALETAALPTVPHAEAVNLYERALEVWDQVSAPEAVAGGRADVLQAAADRARFAGDVDRGLALIEASIRATPPEADRLLRSRRLCTQGRLLTVLMRTETQPVLLEAIALTDGLGPTRERAHALKTLAQYEMLCYRSDDAIVTATEQLEIARQLGHDALAADAHNTMSCCLKSLGRERESIAEMVQAKALAGTNQRTLLRYYVNLSDNDQLQGNYELAAAAARAGVAVAAELGLERSTGAILSGNAAEPLLALGQWAEADRLIRRGMNLNPPLRHRIHLRMLLAWLSTMRDELDAAEELLAEFATALLTPRPDRPAGGNDLVREQEWQAARGLAELALARADAELAWRYVAPQLGWPRPHAPARMYALLFVGAVAAAARGSIERVEAVRTELDRVPAGVQVEPVWRPAITAVLAVGPDALRAVWTQPVRAGEPAHLRPWLGLLLAERLIDGRSRDEARAILVWVRNVTTALGAHLLTRWATDLQQRAGFTRRPDSAAGPLGLTARETEVLRLVAAGKSNAQIGSELFISAKTASVHVSNILAKLHVPSRGEAAARAHASGLI